MSILNKPKYRVSAIVSAFNSERYIVGRLENLIDQSLFLKNQLEIIVVDSCSQQNEGQYVKEFIRQFQHIAYVRTSKKESVYGAWNRGIGMAHGKYIINANTDDRFSETALEQMSAEMETCCDVDAVYGDWLQTETANDRFDSATSKILFSYPEFNPLLLFHSQITSHAALVRKKSFEKIGPYNADFKVYGDREFMLRFAVNGLKAKKIPAIVGLYLKNPEGLEFSESQSGDVEFKRLLEKYLSPEYFIKLADRNECRNNRELAHLYTYAGELGKDFFEIDGQAVSNLGTAGVLFGKALEYDDSNTIALNNLGIIACLSGDHSKGIRLIKVSARFASAAQEHSIAMNISLAERNSKFLTEYNWLTTGSTKNQNQKETTMKTAQEMYREIQPLIENGWHDVALSAYEKLLEVYPQFAMAHNDLGVLCYNMGAKDKAQLHYEKAVEFQAENITFQKNLADFYYAELGRVEEALAIYVRVLEYQPEDVEVLVITGHICVALQKFEDAKDFYQRVLEIEPWNSDARQNLDKLLKVIAGSQVPQSAEDMYHAAQEAASAGRGQEAIHKLETLLSASPDHAPAHNDLGVLLYQAGDSARACEHYIKATQLDPANITFQKNLADLYCIGLDQFEKAMRIYVKILETYPEDIETLMSIGYICENMNKIDDARDFYHRIMEIEPWNFEAKQKLDALNISSVAM